MDLLTITLLVLGVLALAAWGFSYFARPVPTTVVEPAPAPVAWLTLLGIVGLVLLMTGWRFGLEVHPPW